MGTHGVQLEELLEAGQVTLLVQQRQEHLQLQPVCLLVRVCRLPAASSTAVSEALP